MPEYSTPKLTPDETTKLPGMNGSSSGYVLTSELLDIIRSTYGQANGVASLDSSGKLPTAQLPDIADDVLVYASKALLPAQGVEAKIYITTDDNVLYRWDAALGDYVQLSVDLSDYATLDDLASEESAREAADTNLNNALTAIDHRVENLEQAKGDYDVQNYKDGAITPSGKGAWSIVEGLRGVSRVENNLVAPSNLRTREAYGVTITANADGTITVSGTAEASTNLDFTLNNFGTVGHSYVVCGGKSNGNIAINDGTHIVTDSGAGAYLANATGTVKLQFPITNGVNYNVTITPCVTDLNIYFNGSIPSDADTISEIQQNYPHLLTPSEYGTRIVDSSYSGVRAWSRNIFDKSVAVANERWNGSVTSASSGTTRSVLMRVKPSTTYYFKNVRSSSVMTSIYWFDINQNYISSDGIGGAEPVSGTKTSPANACYVGINLPSSALDTCCVNISDSNDGTTTPYMENTLSLTFTGKSAGSVYDQLETNAEIVQEINGQKVTIYKKRETQRIGEKLITDLSFTKASGIFYALLPDAMPVADSNVVANILCEKFIRTSRNGMTQKGQFSISSSGSTVYINFYWDDISIADFLTAMAGISFYYELADPVVTLSDPLIDNTLLTEAYGRMSTVQTGTVVDGSFDLGFINL